ncbi:Protein CBG11631, partial [Caenorhabditis briggsae]
LPTLNSYGRSHLVWRIFPSGNFPPGKKRNDIPRRIEEKKRTATTPFIYYKNDSLQLSAHRKIVYAMMSSKENDNKNKRKQGDQHSMTTIIPRFQARRKEVDSGKKPLDKKKIAELFTKIDQKEMAGNASGSVPEAHKDSTRPSLLDEFQSWNNAASSSNQIPNSTSLSLSTDCPSSSAMNITRQASNRCRSASHIAAPLTEVRHFRMNTPFNPTQSEATVGRNAGEHLAINAPSHPIEIEYDAPQAPTPSVNITRTDGTSPNSIDDIVDRIARGDDSRVGQSSTRKISRRKPISVPATWIDQTGKKIGDAQRTVRDHIAEILAKKKLPSIAETVNLGAGNMGNQETQPTSLSSDARRNSSDSTVNSRSTSQSVAQPEVFATSSNDGNSLLLEIVEDTGVEDNFRMNTPIGMYNEFPQVDIFSVSDYSHSPAPRRDDQPSTSEWYPTSEALDSHSFAPAIIGYNRPSSSSQISSYSLPNLIPTDGATHQTTLSIVPPPRMIESIMKKVSNEMKEREESGSLDFGPIRVKLTATGKELDDSISFLNNLRAQLESAKQAGSYQQL